MMKKIISLGLCLFILTGCTSEYTLSYIDDVFSEDIIIEEDTDIISDPYITITRVESEGDFLVIDENNSYDYTLNKGTDKNVLKLNYTYTDISIESSPVFNNCFRFQYFIEGDNYYYIKLEEGFTCEYLTSANITFRTDKKVYDSNATEIDEENGVYKWTNFTNGDIYIQVSKDITIADAKKSKSEELIPWYIKLIISLVVIISVFIIYKKIKGNQE